MYDDEIDPSRFLRQERTPPEPTAAYMTPQEAADFLGVSISTLYRWRVTQGLRTLRPFLGARPHFQKKDLEAFMAKEAEGKVTVADPPGVSPERIEELRKKYGLTSRSVTS